MGWGGEAGTRPGGSTGCCAPPTSPAPTGLRGQDFWPRNDRSVPNQGFRPNWCPVDPVQTGQYRAVWHSLRHQAMSRPPMCEGLDRGRSEPGSRDRSDVHRSSSPSRHRRVSMRCPIWSIASHTSPGMRSGRGGVILAECAPARVALLPQPTCSSPDTCTLTAVAAEPKVILTELSSVVAARGPAGVSVSSAEADRHGSAPGELGSFGPRPSRFSAAWYRICEVSTGWCARGE